MISTGKKENILVTGGAGYIGSHVVRDLGEAGYHPIVFDNLSSGNREHILHGSFIHGDIKNTRLLSQTIKSHHIDSVLHFAAYIVVEESVRNPFKYYENNSLNSFKLIKTCVASGVKNFVFSSTAAVYGIPEKVPITENCPLKPINPYGKSKLFTEMLLQDIAAANPDFNFIALRYFNVAGADKECRIGQKYKTYSHLITLALKSALGKFPGLKIFGTDYPTPDGTAVRDYIHIDDLAAAHLLALDYLKKEKKSRTFNCGYGTGYTVKQVVETVKKVTGRKFPVENAPRRAGDPPILIADPALIHNETGWVPQFNDLDYIIRSAWEWEKKLEREAML